MLRPSRGTVPYTWHPQVLSSLQISVSADPTPVLTLSPSEASTFPAFRVARVPTAPGIYPPAHVEDTFALMGYTGAHALLPVMSTNVVRGAAAAILWA